MVIVALLAACVVGGTDGIDPDEPLDASFVDHLTEGYHCGLRWYVSHDEDRTLRLQAALLPWLAYPPETGDLEEVDTTLSVGDDAATLQVYQGRCLMTPGCTDDIGPTPGCSGDQQLTHIYDAVAGTAHLEKFADGTIGGSVADLVLEGRDDEATVEVAALELPPFGEGAN
jgi:hypothetical protein